MNTEPNEGICRRWHLLFALLFVLLFQAFARYAAAPVTGLVLDDWSNWYQADSFGSVRETCLKSLCHPDRPLTILATTLGYRLMGDNAAAYAWLSLAGYSIVLALAFFIVYALTRSIYQSTLFGLLFAVLPNLGQHFHWPTQILAAGACALPLYLGSALAWILFVQRGRVLFLLLSALGYGLGLFGYEIGTFLPLAFAVLLVKRTWRSRILVLLPLGVVLGFYAAWRMTNAFGIGFSWYGSPSQMQPNFSLAQVLRNASEIVLWWAGDNVWSSFVGGLKGFDLVGHWPQRWIVLGDVALLAAAGLLLRSLSRTKIQPSPASYELPVFAFASTWVAAAYAPCLISYVDARLNFLPAIGVVFLLSWVLVRLPISKWISGFLVLAFICMLSTQGTAMNWKEAAVWNRNLYAKIAREKPQWQDRKFILFDTRQLAQRLTPGITGPAVHDISNVFHFHNAGLVRGFAPSAMVRRLAGTNSSPIALLDVEYGARIEGDQLIWHDRYDPSAPHTNAAADVYVVDCLDVN